MKHEKPTYQELKEKVSQLELELTKTQWLHKNENGVETLPYNPDYGDLTELNTERTILDNVGKETLKILTSDLMDLLDTSVVIYEKNGDYAYAVFNSGWCQLLDTSSRKLCNTVDNKAALNSGKWLCHEDCWMKSAKATIDNQKRTDINCVGYIKIYAEPIFVQDEVIGAINIGYGNPPTDTKKLKELSEKFNIDFDTLKQKATAYNSRPDFIIDIAKKRLKSVATLIGEYIRREKAEQALKQSEEKLGSIYRVAPTGIGVVVNRVLKEINPYICDMTGYSREELIDKNAQILYPSKEEYEFVGKEKYEQIRKTGTGIVETRWKKKDGMIIHVLLASTPIDVNNHSKGITFTALDVSESKKAEQALIESEERFRYLFRDIPTVAVQGYQFDGTTTYWNKASEDLYGFTAKEAIGRNIFDLIIPEEIKENVRYEIRQMHESLKPAPSSEMSLVRKDGKRVTVISSHAIVQRKDNKPELFCMDIDISQRKQTLNQLEESEQRLKLASKSAMLGVWDWNVKENTMEWDGRMYELYGVKKETFVKNVDAWINGLHPDDKERAIAECNNALDGKSNFDTTFRVKHPDGKVLYIKGDGLVIRDSTGIPIRMIGVNRDVTESKLSEIELLEAKEKAEEANRLKTEFLNNMSHEIRTPMNGIVGFSRMLDKPGLSVEKRKYYSKIVQNSSQQLMRIIDDILEISTLETKQKKLNQTEFCLNDVLMEIFSIFNLKSKEQNIPLYLKKACLNSKSHIISDKTKLNKILSNLLENALKFTSEGFIEFGYNIEKTNLILYVKDTGIGISPKNHKIVFERFSQEEKDISSKHGGLGLGLSICKENAKLLGGAITLDSKKGKGSTFYVTIPYKPVQKADNNTYRSIDSKQDTNYKYTMLVAEDEEVNYLYIEVLFEDELEGDYNLIYAKNGKEAIEICTIDNNIDLVLMDIKMPIMNGLEATVKIKEKFPNLPIIALTAYSAESDKQLALKHGCDDFISKPINKEKLFGLINKYLNVR